MQIFTMSMSITWTPTKEKLRVHYTTLGGRSSKIDNSSFQYATRPSPEHLSQGNYNVTDRKHGR